VSEKSETRSGIVALAGAPNAGKSTLLNRFLGTHLSIATAKPQTTRARVLGIHVNGPVQVVFTDTPGIHDPHNLVHERMVANARREISGADVACWIVDATRGVGKADKQELARLADANPIVVVNKIDRVGPDRLLPTLSEISIIRDDVECFPVSALKGDGVPELLAHIESRMPAGPWLYPEDALTDQPARFFVAELVREQLFHQLDQEMPYRVAVLVETYEQRGKTTYIEATIYVDTTSARKIVLGREGQKIKSVGISARKAIEHLVDGPVYLQLDVRVKKDWQSDTRFLERLGL
jgi:GTP-binding protein Era